FAWLMQKCGAEENVLLAPYSTLRVGGPARYFVMPKEVKELQEIQLACLEHNVDLHVLGGGSNTLFGDAGFDGVVLKLAGSFDTVLGDGQSIIAGAKTSLAKVTKMAIARGWEAAVGWSGIPGLMGGAVSMNAGTPLGEIKDAIETVYGVINGEVIVLDNHEIEFGYRHTNFPANIIIWRVLLRYKKDLRDPSELIVKVEEYRRKRKRTQPTTNSLGSFFKNPYPSYAAQLIENCNLKGLKYKRAQISPLHANFIVNNGGAFADDILQIATMAKKAVFDKFGITLVPEVRFVGKFAFDPIQFSPLPTTITAHCS
ncbi:MAG TPA: UDP-N-acetylmuramate dehydrogenase, partial [Myxococcota bacterium]|nr:UDP-N-acetylmuramate dehydrogenase [Myxococcota bacterium]